MAHKDHWQRFLLPGERVIHTFGVSRVYLTMFFLFPFLLFFALGMFALIIGQILGVLFLVASLGLLLPLMYMWFFVQYAITDNRVMSRVGIFTKQSVSVDLTAITDIHTFEPFWERLVSRSGTMGVNTAGGSRMELILTHVSKPDNLKQDIYKHLRELVVRTQQQGHGVVQR
jgi:uncharacterized membrane protein YdbT with pleckstrin-like domain